MKTFSQLREASVDRSKRNPTRDFLRKYPVSDAEMAKPITYYSLVHKATNKVLSTHRDLESAKDEHRGMDQGERAHYRIATSTKAPKSFSMKEDAEGVAEAAKWRQGYRASGHPPGYQHKSGEIGPLGGTYDTTSNYGDEVKVPVNRYRDEPDRLADREKTKLSTSGKPLTAKNAARNLKTAIRQAKGRHGPVGVLPEQGVAEGSGKNVVKSIKVGNFRHDLVDTGMGWQVRIYNGDELYDTGVSKNSEQKGLAALEDAVAYTEKQTRTKRQGVAEGERKLGPAPGQSTPNQAERAKSRDHQRTDAAKKARDVSQRKGLKQDKDGTYYAKEGVAEGKEELHAQLQSINQKLKLMRGGPVGEPNSVAFVEKRKALLKQKEQILSQLKQGVAEGWPDYDDNQYSLTDSTGKELTLLRGNTPEEAIERAKQLIGSNEKLLATFGLVKLTPRPHYIVRNAKRQGVEEGYTGRETKDGTWRVFKDGQAVAVAGPYKSREEAAAWIKKQKQGVAEAAFKDPSPMMKDSIKQDKIRSLKNLIAIAKVKGVQHKVKEYESELKKLQEASVFPYTKPPRKGSVAYNALMKRKEQDKKRVKEIEAIGTKNHHVGVAKVVTKEDVEDVTEASDADKYSYIDQTKGPILKGKTGTFVGYTHSTSKGKGANILKHNKTGKYYAAGGSSTAFTQKTTLHDTPEAAAKAYHKGNLAEASPMIKPPKNEFGKKEEAFAHAKQHGGKVMKKTFTHPTSGMQTVSYVVKKD